VRNTSLLSVKKHNLKETIEDQIFIQMTSVMFYLKDKCFVLNAKFHKVR